VGAKYLIRPRSSYIPVTCRRGIKPYSFESLPRSAPRGQQFAVGVCLFRIPISGTTLPSSRHPALPYSSFHGFRNSRPISLLASESPRMRSFRASHLSLRPTNIEISPRCPEIEE
jgi:hypothetical protein